MILPLAERYRMARGLTGWCFPARSKVCLRVIRTMSGCTCRSTSPANRWRTPTSWRGRRRRCPMPGRAVATRICLEFAEADVKAGLAEASRHFAALRATGASVALDDFGAGGTSLTYLESLPVDWLKIDGQVISRLPDNPIDRFDAGLFPRCRPDPRAQDDRQACRQGRTPWSAPAARDRLCAGLFPAPARAALRPSRQTAAIGRLIPKSHPASRDSHRFFAGAEKKCASGLDLAIMASPI